MASFHWEGRKNFMTLLIVDYCVRHALGWAMTCGVAHLPLLMFTLYEIRALLIQRTKSFYKIILM